MHIILYYTQTIWWTLYNVLLILYVNIVIKLQFMTLQYYYNNNKYYYNEKACVHIGWFKEHAHSPPLYPSVIHLYEFCYFFYLRRPYFK